MNAAFPTILYMYKMKSILLIILILLTNCGNRNGNDKEEPKPNVPVTWSFSPETLTDFTSQSGTQSIIITSNTAWKATSDQTWCTPAETEGSPGSFSLKISVQKNTTTTARTALITFTAKDAVKIPTEFIYFDREVPLYVLNMEIQITSGRDLFQETIARSIKKETKNQ